MQQAQQAEGGAAQGNYNTIQVRSQGGSGERECDGRERKESEGVKVEPKDGYLVPEIGFAMPTTGCVVPKIVGCVVPEIGYVVRTIGLLVTTVGNMGRQVSEEEMQQIERLEQVCLP